MKYIMLIVSAVFTVWSMCVFVLDIKAFIATRNVFSLVMAAVFGFLTYWNAKGLISRIGAPNVPKN